MSIPVLGYLFDKKQQSRVSYPALLLSSIVDINSYISIHESQLKFDSIIIIQTENIDKWLALTYNVYMMNTICQYL